MNKIKRFFKKFWYFFLIPIGLFVIARVFKKDTSGTKKLIKEKTKSLKENEKEIKKEKEVVEKNKEDLDNSINHTEEVLNLNLKNKKERDNEAKKFFTDM